MLRNFQSHAPGFSRPPGPLQRRAVRLTHARGAARSRAHSSRRERRTSPRTHTRDSPRTRATMSASVVRGAAATPALSARRGAGADARGWPSSRAGEHSPGIPPSDGNRASERRVRRLARRASARDARDGRDVGSTSDSARPGPRAARAARPAPIPETRMTCAIAAHLLCFCSKSHAGPPRATRARVAAGSATSPRRPDLRADRALAHRPARPRDPRARARSPATAPPARCSPPHSTHLTPAPPTHHKQSPRSR